MALISSSNTQVNPGFRMYRCDVVYDSGNNPVVPAPPRNTPSLLSGGVGDGRQRSKAVVSH